MDEAEDERLSSAILEMLDRYENMELILQRYLMGEITQQETLNRLVDICRNGLMPEN